MRALLVITLISSAVIATAVPAFALDDIILNDGTIRRGTITAVEDDGIRVKFTPKGGGTAQMKVPARRLDPHFFYNLRDDAAGEDAKAHLKLGLWAVENGLFSRAKLQITRATELDPKLVADIQEGKLPEIREGIAKRVLDSAKKDVEDGRIEWAEKKVEALLARMPDTEAGADAADYIHVVQKAAGVQEEKAEEEREAKIAEEQQEADDKREKLLEPVDKELKAGKKNMTEGLTADKESTALTKLKRALTNGESALKKLDKLERDQSSDAELMKSVESRKTKTIDAMVSIHIHRADIYNSRSSRPQARKELEAARKLDPDNPEIAQTEQRIDDGDNQDVWDVRWRRNNPPGAGRFAGRRAGGARVGGARGGGGGGRR